jgi:hypothetical protein
LVSVGPRDRDRAILAAVATVDWCHEVRCSGDQRTVTELGMTLPSVASPVHGYVGGHGDAGRHTRTVVGMDDLSFNLAVEIEMTARVRD